MNHQSKAPMVRNNSQVFFVSITLLVLIASTGVYSQTDWKNWPNEMPQGCPFPQSQRFSGITFTGQIRNISTGDTWYPMWGSDDRLYSPFADGGGAMWPNQGYGILTGNDPMMIQIASTGIIQGNNIHSPYGGLYPSAGLFFNGIWYWGEYTLNDLNGSCQNWCSGGPFIGFWTSIDTGRTWVYPKHTATTPLFGESGLNGARCKIMAPHTVDFGKNMQYSPDGKMYMTAHGATRAGALDNWIAGDQIYLLRCIPSIQAVNDSTAWEYYCGKDNGGNEIWTHDFRLIKPILEWNSQMGCVTVTYNAPLAAYFMCISRPTDGFNCAGDYDSYILEAPSLTGPWSIVHYLKRFGAQAYFDCIPSKFISADGLKAWLLYSANFTGRPSNPPGSGYGMTWAEFTLSRVPSSPFVRLSESLISVDYERGQPWASQSRIVTAVNSFRNNGIHVAGPATVTQKSAWLSVAVNAANPDSQVITNTINPSSLPDTEATYYDTVNVHVAGAEITDLTYQVKVRVLNQSAISSIVVTPAIVSISAGQPVQFTAVARDQYDQPLPVQPPFLWSASTGTINGNGVYASGGCAHTATITVSASGVQGTAVITVTPRNEALSAAVTASSVYNGYSIAGVNDGVVGGYPSDISNEWASQGETMGAWVQLTWTNPVAIDSIALWDRPNTQYDQVLSGTLTFSDGSSISVGTLPDDAVAPWSQKFTGKTITWAKLIVNTVRASSLNIGLAEFGAYSSENCTPTVNGTIGHTQPPRNSLTIKGKRILITAPLHTAWTFEIFDLGGSVITRISGNGATEISPARVVYRNGYSIARLITDTDIAVLPIAR